MPPAPIKSERNGISREPTHIDDCKMKLPNGVKAPVTSSGSWKTATPVSVKESWRRDVKPNSKPSMPFNQASNDPNSTQAPNELWWLGRWGVSWFFDRQSYKKEEEEEDIVKTKTSMLSPMEYGPPRHASLKRLGHKGSLSPVTWLGKERNCKMPVTSPRVGRPGKRRSVVLTVKEVAGSMAARDEEPWPKLMPTDPLRRSIVGSTEKCGACDIR